MWRLRGIILNAEREGEYVGRENKKKGRERREDGLY